MVHWTRGSHLRARRPTAASVNQLTLRSLDRGSTGDAVRIGYDQRRRGLKNVKRVTGNCNFLT